MVNICICKHPTLNKGEYCGCWGFSYDLFNVYKSNVVKALCESLKLYIVHNSKLTHYDIANDSTSLLDYFLITDISVISLVGQVQRPTISNQALIIADFKFVDIPLHAFTKYLLAVNVFNLNLDACYAQLIYYYVINLNLSFLGFSRKF
uniref:Uncharacterized protein n=1 Tax=Glossina pallidipes TaxID=7398 RepID=A0A1A9Z272_GLOPL